MTARETVQPLMRTLSQLKAKADECVGLSPHQSLDALMSWSAACRHPILFTDRTARYLGGNPSALQLTGFSPQELRRKTVWDLTDSAREREFEPLWRAFLEAGTQRGEYKLRRKSGPAITVVYVACAHVLAGVHVSVLTPARGARRPTRSRRAQK